MWALLLGLGPKLWLYTGIFVFILSVLGGVYVKGRSDCSAAYQTAELRAQIEALKAANKSLLEDATQARSDDEASRKLKEIADALEDKIADGDCFTADESDSLRKLWSVD